MAARAPIAGLDPGRSKCGLVLSDAGRGRIVQAAVLPPAQTLQLLQRWHGQEGLRELVLGDGTGSRDWSQRLREDWQVRRVDERGSTLEARHRYWQLEPPRGWRRLLPRGLRQPPRDWDDVVAQLLLERWLERPLVRRPGLTPLRCLPADPSPTGPAAGADG